MSLNKHFDYANNYNEIVHTTQPISAGELADKFFCAVPWIITLMKLRTTDLLRLLFACEHTSRIIEV